MYILSKYDYFCDGNIWNTYMEVIDNYVRRQVMVHKDNTIASNRHHHVLGYYLLDTELNTDSLEGVEVIKKDKFEEAWEKHINKFRASWGFCQKSYKLGDSVQGMIKAIYPHGIIVEIGADIGFCLKSEKEYNVGDIASFQVEGFDNKNLWIILKS